MTQRSYSGGTAVATPTVNYFYDASTVTNSKGRLTSVSSSVSGYNYSGYDALGRVTSSQQVTDGQTYSMSYQYDLAGNMTSQTYPTGRVVTQSFDTAGRLANIRGQASAGTPKTYANSFGYTPHGAVERMRLGNGRWEHTNFNNRLQPTEIGLGSSATDSSVLKLNYEYGTSTNNGNVLKQVITVPTIGTATGFTATQHYQYDQLNRLTGAQEVNGVSSAWQTSGAFWQQKFTYDRFGNRAVDTANTTSTMIGPNPQISTSNNRMVPRTSPVEYYHYDAAGNLDIGQSGDTSFYDAENKLVQYQGGATQSGGANYSYDGDGRRIKKSTPAETLTFIYNISGQLVAEYTTSTTQNNGTSYLTSDTLGSPRAITKADGTVWARHDYLPFGEELYASAGSRTTGQKYDDGTSPTDKSRQKFTSKERDNETGLDYFLARYYGSAAGRFTSADPLLSSADTVQPQSWNRYTYALNNPSKYTDPLGLFVWSNDLGGGASDADLLTNAGKDNKKKKAAEKIIGKRNLFRNALVAAQKAAGKCDDPIKVLNAIASYGKENEANGVEVTFGKVNEGSTAETSANNGIGLNFNADGTITANVLVTFKEGLDGNELTMAVGHEGQHVADRQNFALAATSHFWAEYGQDEVFKGRFNPTLQTTELRAYRITSLLAQGLGLPNLEQSGNRIWDSGWRQADRTTLRDNAINRYLSGSSTYNKKLNDRVFPN